MRAIHLFLFLGCILLPPLTAETGMSGPVLGFVFDPANGLQPILGVAGALTMGAPAELPGGLAKFVIAPRQDYALAVADADSSLLRIGIASPLSIESLGVPVSGTDTIALSPNGSAAAFYDRAKNRVQVVAGLPSAATLSQEFDLSVFPGTLTSLAVNDSAGVLIAAFSGPDQKVVVVLGAAGAVRILPAPQSATAIAFLAGGPDVLIADGDANRIYLVKDPTGAAETTLLADETQGIAAPVAIAASKDNKRAFVANSSLPGIATIDLAGGGVTSTPCRCAPSQLNALNGNAAFRLTEPSAGPIWVFDGDGDEPRIVFVPPYQPATEGAPQ